MNQLGKGTIIAFFVVASMLASSVTFADDEKENGQRFAVTITNITRGQVITPPVVISHNDNFKLFILGSPAIPELAALAEDGPTAPLLGFLATRPDVYDFAASAGPLLPGNSVTLEISSPGDFRYISAAGMLATTNDAFFAIRGVRVPKKGQRAVEAEAYDAGSEANNESCEFIPGPPCGSAGVRATEGAEGYVHIHSGIHGIGDLVPAVQDWRNPVGEILIRRIP